SKCLGCLCPSLPRCLAGTKALSRSLLPARAYFAPQQVARRGAAEESERSFSSVLSFHLGSKSTQALFDLFLREHFVDPRESPYVPERIANPAVPVSPKHICRS